MNAKEEKIKSAYGEYWETVKDFVDENGYCNKRDLFQSKKIRYEEIDLKFTHHTDFTMRPKVLENIENNNGWKKTQTQNKDFEDWFTCWVYSDMIQYATWNPIQQYFSDTDGMIIKNVTHYQPIIKPNPPLY
jgi:hypothetical protein